MQWQRLMAAASANPPSDTSHPSEQRRMHPLLRKLHVLFSDLAANKPLPPASALTAESLSWLNGCYCTVSVQAQEKDYFFDCCGRHMHLFGGRNIRGRRLSEMEALEDISWIREDLDLVMLARRPRYSSGSMIWDSGLRLECEWLILPFTGRQGQITTLLVAEKLHAAPGGRPYPPRYIRKLPRLEMHAMVWPAFHRPMPGDQPSDTYPHHH